MGMSARFRRPIPAILVDDMRHANISHACLRLNALRNMFCLFLSIKTSKSTRKFLSRQSPPSPQKKKKRKKKTEEDKNDQKKPCLTTRKAISPETAFLGKSLQRISDESGLAFGLSQRTFDAVGHLTTTRDRQPPLSPPLPVCVVKTLTPLPPCLHMKGLIAA